MLMKSSFTTLSLTLKRISGRCIFVLLLSACAFAVFGQSANPADELGDLSQKDWKPVPEMNQKIDQERARTNVLLALSDLQPTDRSLYLSYERLLDYVQADIQSNVPVDEAISKNYQKVLNGAYKDPDLMNLPPNSLAGLMPALLEALTVVPEAAPNTAN